MSFGNTEVIPHLGNWFRPLTGQDPYNKKNVEASQQCANQSLKVLEDHLMINTYLVGERITLADLMVAGFLTRGFENVLDKKWRQEHPSLTRWYETIANQPIYKAVIPEPKFCTEALKNQQPAQPKKEAKKEQPKKAKDADDEEDEPAPAPKAKHPIEALGRPTFAIDDWKRKFKNEETREVALPWFWENINFEEYSIWRVDYKYNDELTMTFMSANLVGKIAHDFTFAPSENVANQALHPFRRLLRSPRSFAEVPARLHVGVRQEQRLGHQRSLVDPWPRRRPGLRRRTGLGELRIHKARPEESRGQDLLRGPDGLGQGV